MILSPDFSKLSADRATSIESFSSFIMAATVSDFSSDEFQIELFETTALVTYSFTIEYEMHDKTYRKKGNDLFAFERSENGWLAVWRM